MRLFLVLACGFAVSGVDARVAEIYVTLRAHSSSGNLSETTCSGQAMGWDSETSECGRSCTSVRFAFGAPPSNNVEFTLKDQGSAVVAFAGTIGATDWCVAPQLCGNSPSMIECAGWFWGLTGKANWKITPYATNVTRVRNGIPYTIPYSSKKLYQIVSVDCPTNQLRMWAPESGENTNLNGCQLAFPGDPAGGACTANCTRPLTGSEPLDVWEIEGLPADLHAEIHAQQAMVTSAAAQSRVILLAAGLALTMVF